VTILIRNGRVMDPKSGLDDKLDILIKGNRIERIDKHITGTGVLQVIDAEGHFVAPGLVDVHAHLREPGYEYKETIKTGSMAAVKGGFTAVVAMANTSPVNDNASVTEYILEKARTQALCRVLPCGAITKGLKGEELAEIGEMHEAGIVALSDDGRSVKNSGLMRKALEYAKRFSLPVICHCEDEDLSQGYVHEGYASLHSGLDSVPAIAEEIMVKRDISIARYVDAPVHLTHISARGSAEAIRQEKRGYKQITCDTCPHYFTLTDQATLGYDTNTKVNPPLRGTEDVSAIKEALRNNTVEIIATDHAPHELSSKDVEFNMASFGITGLETAFALSLTLVHEGILSLMDLLKKLTINPARLLRLPYGRLGPGRVADLIIFNPDMEWAVNRDNFVSKGRNTPFHGWKLRGKNLLTMVDGKVVYTDRALR
jgi:dihydroorotase